MKSKDVIEQLENARAQGLTLGILSSVDYCGSVLDKYELVGPASKKNEYILFGKGRRITVKIKKGVLTFEGLDLSAADEERKLFFIHPLLVEFSAVNIHD